MGGGDAEAPALEARSITLSWDGGATIVCKDVSFALEAGQTACLVGRSGCGKTTLLHALSGLTRPCAGSVCVHGLDVTGHPGHVSYMLQKDLLLPHLTILDNVCLPLTLAGMPKAQAYEWAADLLPRFGLAGTERSWPAQLSGGMRQRAAFLRTYLQGSDVMLLDEPFSALDAFTRADLRSWFTEMASTLHITALIITHDVDEAASLGQRVFALTGRPSTAVEVEADARAVLAVLGEA